MQRRWWTTFTALGLALTLSGGMMFAADDKDPKKDDSKKEEAKKVEKEVELPKLPKGAGKVDKDAPKTLTETKSGLKYRILRKGNDKKPKATNKVEVHYHGWLDGGKVFDSSYERNESIAFGLNQVIPGWTEGMQLVGEGGMIELEIPSKLGYGDRGSPPVIPPKANLHFLVELIEIK
ncbi:MAG: FKBP-type peptidyl-prolyl cis-trans isomerase [Planctomycetes bacterium]|nr:FKBP-type peptidyl-prolyl cis-trans isomerase [Planctomycetota bacterium]